MGIAAAQTGICGPSTSCGDGPGWLAFGGAGDLAGGTSRGRVLIVEDEAITAWELSDIVADLGYEVCGTVACAGAAVRLAETEAPDVILMDVRLGRGPDGITAAEQILAKRRVPIIFCTAYAGDPSMLARMQKLDPVAVLSKPIGRPDLEASLRHALSGSGST